MTKTLSGTLYTSSSQHRLLDYKGMVNYFSNVLK